MSRLNNTIYSYTLVQSMTCIHIATQRHGKHNTYTRAQATVGYPLLANASLTHWYFPWGPCRGVINEVFFFHRQISFHRLLHTHHLSTGFGTKGQLLPDVSCGHFLTPPEETSMKIQQISANWSQFAPMSSAEKWNFLRSEVRYKQEYVTFLVASPKNLISFAIPGGVLQFVTAEERKRST